MRPLRLTIKGLRSYREQVTIDFRGLDLFAVIGDTGAGKSTIIEALSFALYARKTWTGGSLSDLVAEGQNEAVVELVFEAGGSTWTVLRKRGVKAGNTIDKLACEGVDTSWDGADAVNEKVKHLLGMDHGQFVNAVVMRQGNFDKLLTLGATDRAKLLGSIFGLDRLADVQKWTLNEHKRWSDKLIKAEERRAVLPADPAATLREATSTLEGAEARRTALSEAAEALAGHERARTAAAGAAERLRVRLSVVPSEGPAALGALATVWAEAVALLEEREAIGDRIEQLGAKADELLLEERRVLCGFTDRDALVRAETTVLAAAEELAAAQESLQSIEASIATLDDDVDPESLDPRLTEALTEAESAEREATASLDAAHRAHSGAQQLWSARSAAAESIRALVLEAGGASEAAKLAAARHAELQEAATVASAALSEARAVRDAEDRASLVARIVEDLAAGDACPICSHPVDAAHLERHRAGGRDGSGARVAEAEKALQQAVADAAKAQATQESTAARLEQITGRFAAAEEALEAAEARCVEAGMVVTADDEATALAPLSAEVTRAVAALDQARTAAAAARTALLSAQATLEAAVKARGQQVARLEAERAKVLASIRALTARVAALPTGFVDLEDLTPDELRNAAVKLDAVGADHLAVAAERKGVDAELTAQRALLARVDERARTEVLVPASAAVSLLSGWVTPLREVAAELPAAVEAASALVTLTAPRKVGEIDALQSAASAVVEAGRRVEQLAGEAMAEQLAAAERERVAADAVLRAAGAASSAALTEELGGVIVQVRQAQEAISTAQAAVERAELLDRQLAALRPVCAELETLKVSLTFGAFITHLLDSRTAELLEEAGRRLGEITNGIYDFTDDFAIVESLTGAVRTPDMLSGGERFQAALALSLALVEIAARAGGRLGAVFVDEGFGSLDTRSLALALDTLGSVAGGGKMVGLISHLHPVAEYVDTVFHVTKDKVRGSMIERLDGSDRESLLFDEDGDAGLTS